MKCWKCGQEIVASVCPYCGAHQTRSAAHSEVGRALRQLFDRYGAQAVLSGNTYIVYGLGDLVQDAKKTRNLFRIALDAGLGRMYLEQLQTAGKPDAMFLKRAATLLTEDAGLSSGVAAQLMGWLDEMIGWGGSGSGAAKQDGDGGIIGIDLGTSYTRAAVVVNGKPVIIPTAEGRRCRPSVVGLRNDRFAVCEEALQQGVKRPAIPVKSTLGQRFGPMIGGRLETSQFYTALIFRKIIQDAERFLGRRVTRAVVTVPNCFTNIQRLAVCEAGRIAGIEIVRLINASSAAALGACWQEKADREMLVFGLGGGALDVSFVEWGDGVLEVVAISGDCELGGEEYDARIVNWLKEEFKKTSGIDLDKDREAEARLKDAAGKAKEELSGAASTRIFIPYLTSGANGVHNLDVTLTRAKFDELTRHLVDRASNVIRQMLNDCSQMPQRDPHKAKVLFVGGASRIPAFRDMARRLAGQGEVLGVQPDEVTALGAALQGHKLIACNRVDYLLLDASALSAGIKTLGGIYSPIYKRHSTFDTQGSEMFSTAEDNQSTVEVHIYQGNEEMAVDNVCLGTFAISGIPPAPKGVPQVQVTIQSDLSGLVEAKAKEESSGKEQSSGVLSPIRLSESQIRNDAVRAAQIVP